MPEKLVSGIAIAVASILSIVLSVWAKIRFVNKNEIYDEHKRPFYQHKTDCDAVQNRCHDVMCKKIDDLQSSYEAMWDEFRSLHRDITDIKTAIAKLEQWMTDRNNK